jgi:RHS repeat-associated protein
MRTGDTNFVYQWDGLNRLRALRQRGAASILIASYNYDAWPAIYHGRRVQKIVAHRGALDGTTRYYYDGHNTIEETIVPTNAPERVARQFLYGSRADEVLAMDADTNNDGNPDQLSFYLRDHNNNTTQLVDASGQPVEFYFYDYRGRPLFFKAVTGVALTNSARGNPYLFQGQRYDPETSLYYCKARYYDPTYGVFLSRDPLRAWRDSANHGNGMAFVGNSPWNWTDPSGLVAVTFEDCDDPICPGGPTQAAVKAWVNDGCEKIKKAKLLLAQLAAGDLIPGTDTGAETMEILGVNLAVIKAVTGRYKKECPGDWLRNFDRLQGILDGADTRCGKGITIECGGWQCLKGDDAYTDLPDGNVHLCLPNFATSGQERLLIQHELSHYGGSTDDDNDKLNAYALGQTGLIIDSLARAWDTWNPK